MMQASLSNKIRIASLICTFLVVLRHSNNLIAFFGWYGLAPKWLYDFEWMCSRFTDIAVPFFFLISGYFFFRFKENGLSMKDYLDILRKKSRTLLIPFVVWNLVGAVIMIGLKVMPMPNTVWDGLMDLLMSTCNGALWYVRNLMLMMALVPLYGWLFGSKKMLAVQLIVLVGIMYVWMPVDCRWYSTEGWLFFLIGGMLQQYYPELKTCSSKRVRIALVIAWIVMCFNYNLGGMWMFGSTVFIGVLAMWHLLDLIPERLNKVLIGVAGYSFFIYVLHIYIMKIAKNAVAHFFHGNALVACVLYIVAPIVTFFALLVLGKIWNKHFHKSFAFVTGGRA